MNKTLATTSMAIAVSAAALGLAGTAAAAPGAGSENAASAIMALEDQGNRVVVSRLSDTPLDQAMVVSVTHGPDIRQGVPFATSQGEGYRSMSNQTVYVTVK